MKSIIALKLRAGLLNEMFFLSPPEIKNLAKVGAETAFDSPNMAAKYINTSLTSLNKLPDMVTLYRVIFANSKEDINTNEIGSHYVLSRKQLEQSHHQASHVGGGKPFMLTVKAPKDLIDLQTTLKNKVMYPHENEITLKNKGVGGQIVKVEPFVQRDEFEDFLY